MREGVEACGVRCGAAMVRGALHIGAPSDVAGKEREWVRVNMMRMFLVGSSPCVFYEVAIL